VKKKLPTLEGDIYRRMSDLVIRNRDVIETHRPKVSKNSAGYALWSVFDVENGTFNLAKLLCGAQGTLALTTSMTFRLIRPQPSRAMLVIFLKELSPLPEIVRRVLRHNPESFESYDDHTFSLAVKYLPQMLSQMGLIRAVRLGISFVPEMLLALQGGIPKLVLMAEFSEDTPEEALKKAWEAEESLKDLKLPTSIKPNEAAAEKYWIVRRESFALLRKNLKGLYASPFIDDFVVPPDSYPEFLPRLEKLLGEYDLIYTIAGHVGNGNFHIIPLMDLSKDDAHKVILELSPKVYDLVMEYGGSTTGEHNDGIIRTPYLSHMFGSDMMKLFEETKRIFDPLNILNPGKKVGGTFKDIEQDMIRGM
jgi:FAD/FMN-containing dehydrogenase